MKRDQTKDAQSMYDDRSVRYDNSWHPRFARHMVELAKIQPGEDILDLACGTGLVSFPASTATGPSGSVTGVDISKGMLAQAETKKSSHNLDNVEFHWHSMTDLTSLEAINNRKFDAITCASALVLLPQPGEALKEWTSFLKPGGRLIVDVTHPMSQIHWIAFEHVGNQLDLPVPGYRVPFQKPEDLRLIMERAGLRDVDVKLLSQLDIDGTDGLEAYTHDFDSPRIERAHDVSDADAVFDKWIASSIMSDFAQDSVKHKARSMFREEWKKLADESGTINEVDGVFVGIGRMES